jgi:hypothetical protein
MRTLLSSRTVRIVLVMAIFWGGMWLLLPVFDSVEVEPLHIVMNDYPPILVSPVNPNHISLFASGGKEPYKWAVYEGMGQQRKELPDAVYDYVPEPGVINDSVTLEVTDRKGVVAQQGITLWIDESADINYGPLNADGGPGVDMGGDGEAPTTGTTAPSIDSCTAMLGFMCSPARYSYAALVLAGLLIIIGCGLRKRG